MRQTAKQSVLLHDGRLVRSVVYLYEGAAIAGDATAYILLDHKLIWVKPGQSVDWLEA